MDQPLILIGSHRAQAVDGHLSYTSKGNEQVVVKFVIIGGLGDGRTLPWYGFFSEACFDRTIQALRYCGWKGDDVSDLSGLDANEVEIVVEHKEYNGERHASIRWVNQVGGGAGMPPDKAKAFAESIKRRIAGMTPAEPEPTEEMPF